MKLSRTFLFFILAGLLFLAYTACSSAPPKESIADAAAGGETAEKSMPPEPSGGGEAASESISPSEGAALDGPAPAADEEMLGAKENGGGAHSEEPAPLIETEEEIAASEGSSAVLPQPEPVYLSADDSNSAASPVIARKLIRAGEYVHPGLVRTYEFLNYYSFDYEPPEQDEIAIIPQMREKPGDPGVYSLQVALRSRDRSFQEAAPFQLTLLLDISGSMAGESMDMAKQFLLSLNSRLRPKDRLSLVTFNRDAEAVIVNAAPGEEFRRTLEGPVSTKAVTDITNLESGILLAYTIAEETYSFDKLNRVVVISDGGANAGTTAKEVIGEYARDSEKQGIYLAGISMGEGFNDSMMNALTDMGRGAYVFLDTPEEVEKVLSEENFLSIFDLAVKDVRLKMEMPPGWEMQQFHGEQMSTTASEVIPQYLSPGDQMIYHMEIKTVQPEAEIGTDRFVFEAQYAPIGGRIRTKTAAVRVEEMRRETAELIKGDAVTEYAELLKSIRLPLDSNVTENLALLDEGLVNIKNAAALTGDRELGEIVSLLSAYRLTLQFGEQLGNTLDKQSGDIPAALNVSPNHLVDMEITGDARESAIKVLSRLGTSTRLLPQEGYKFVALSSGPVGNTNPAGSGDLTGKTYRDPSPRFLGYKQHRNGSGQAVYDLHTIKLTLRAPSNARSFSFDFNFFSAEYPDYIQQNFNDTFYAIIEADSTNQGAPTNIAFDANNNSIEVDNNYFQNPFHPIPNTGTGFDYHGSTGWLRTSWPVKGGEQFTLTFSIHDEGDGIYDSLVILDNFAFHGYEAVGTTDPLN